MISSNASTFLPSNMNEEQRLHQEKKAEVENVAALEAALDAFTVIRNPSGSTCLTSSRCQRHTLLGGGAAPQPR